MTRSWETPEGHGTCGENAENSVGYPLVIEHSYIENGHPQRVFSVTNCDAPQLSQFTKEGTQAEW